MTTNNIFVYAVDVCISNWKIYVTQKICLAVLCFKLWMFGNKRQAVFFTIISLFEWVCAGLCRRVAVQYVKFIQHTEQHNIDLKMLFYNLDDSCDPWKFYCPVGICIPWNSTCNGISDCPSGADEPSICGNTSRGMWRSISLVK
jgi:hypothetical protein